MCSAAWFFPSPAGVGLLASIARTALCSHLHGFGGDGRTDLLPFLIVGATVLGVTLLAAYVPARRASRLNPNEALRHE